MPSIKGKFAPSIIFILLLLAYHLIFRGYFPNDRGLLGHDFAGTLPVFLDGFIWFKTNGLFEVPWFTPSFCGGQPFFADPQSSYYSVPQFLTFMMDPLTASYLTLLLFAAIGFWGFYLLMRIVFKAGWESSVFAGAVFMFNGFLSHRMIIGEYGYHGFTLIPWVALLLLHPMEIRFGILKRGGNAIGAGILVAYWLHSALTTLMVPMGLSVFVIGCAYGLRSGGNLLPFFVRSFGAVMVALALCASKLMASLSFFSHFPRAYYALPGIDGIGYTVVLAFKSLFYSSQSVATDAVPLLRNVQWTVFPHEWAYGLTLIPLFIIIAGIGLFTLRAASGQDFTFKNKLNGRSLAILAMLCLVLALPIALNFYSPGWNAILKHVPMVKSGSWPFRWLLIYIPVVVLLASLIFDHEPLLQRYRMAILSFSLIGIVLLNVSERQEYYQDQPYSPVTIQQAYKEIARGKRKPRVDSVGVLTDQHGNLVLPVGRNDLVATGMSQLYCYNPVFGYRLETFPLKDTQPGPVLSEVNGHFNLKNPACYVWPHENKCMPGDHFTLSQQNQLESFAQYRPFAFNKSLKQLYADRVTGITLIILAGLALSGIVAVPFRKQNGNNA